ncbi:uncharacterized protein F4817DRAFT_309542 [Daldinia loculata]|uniref:uncharacterized protein n=1 Tax=Daldinia loculata TaxID=103429 RepID=UPI0020C1C5DC|nr:uncharacterized protein F4817DRAFT_309542 [Daldinia loculata]KAI1642164.1 hypothetical protein F4817DRAFT_309542 [Daldinia loculata]
MSQGNGQPTPWYSVVDDIEHHLAEIDHAIEVIGRHKAEIRRLIGTILEPRSPSTQSSLLGNEKSVFSNPEQPRLHPNPTDDNEQYCPHPDCNKGPFDGKLLRRHYQTHVYCSDVSSEDAHCARCRKPLSRVSIFSRIHAKCVEQVSDQLPQGIIGKALKQRHRIIQASNNQLSAALQNKKGPPKNSMKRGQDPEYEKSSPKMRRTEVVDASSTLHIPRVDSGRETSFSTSFVPVAPGLSFPPSKPELASNYTGTFPASMTSGLASQNFPSSQSTTDQYDGRLYRRSLTMVVNPMDGLY